MSDDSTYKPIACHLYDYIEAACVHHYEIVITLHNGKSCRGIARDVKAQNSQEWFVVQTSSGNEHIRLDCIAMLKVLSEPRIFDRVDF